MKLMADLATKFASKSQEWETPDDLFAPLDAEFHFGTDVCASSENTKCFAYYSREQDALTRPWGGTCWMNPPFNELGKWVKKAYESSCLGATVVCLLPCRTNTQWWHTYCMKAEVRFLLGRPKFNGSQHGLPQPLAIVVFRPEGKTVS